MGKLFLVPTPIGNLDDITLRAIKVLSSADIVLAEDTRTTQVLLKHLGLDKKLWSHHKFNEHAAVESVAATIAAGETVALVSDAGTPGISDPGFLLVRTCLEHGIEVETLPGATAFVPALVNSGFPCDRFCFEGFLPFDDKKEKKAILEELKEESRTIILYEAPHHLVRTLSCLYEELGNRKVTLCRELTKKFETIMPTTLEDALHFYETNDPRGEYVLVLEGKSHEEKAREKEASFAQMSMEEHMKFYEDQGMDRKDAMKLVAKDRGISKRDVYQYFIKNEERSS